MRALDCECGRQLEAASDEELFQKAREHVDLAHPDMALDDEQVRSIVEQGAYDKGAAPDDGSIGEGPLAGRWRPSTVSRPKRDAKGEDRMPAEENKALAHEAIKEFNEGNMEKYLAHYDEGVVTHGYPPELPANLDGLKAFYAMLGAAFPDTKVAFDDIVAEGDEIAIRYTFRATHRGDFMGIPPTGKEVSMGGITILRIRGGKIVERWQNSDLMGLMGQLGAIPQTAEA